MKKKRAALSTLCLRVACVAALLGCNAIDEAHFRAVSGARSHGNRASGVLAPSQPMLDDDLLGLNVDTTVEKKADIAQDHGGYGGEKLKEIEDRRQLKFHTAKEAIVKSQLTNDLLALETKTLCDEEYMNTFDLMEDCDPFSTNLKPDLIYEKVHMNEYVEEMAESLRAANLQLAYLSKVRSMLGRQRGRLYRQFTQYIIAQIKVYAGQYTLQGSLYRNGTFLLSPHELKKMLKTSYDQEMKDLDALYTEAQSLYNITERRRDRLDANMRTTRHFLYHSQTSEPEFEALFEYAKILDSNIFYACSNFQNTTSQSISVLVKALGGIEDGAMLSKASFEVGKPERVFNFSELLTRHEARHGRPGETNHSEDKEEKENNATIIPVKENDNSNAVAIMEQLKEEKKEDQKSQEASGLAVFFKRWLRL